MVVSSLNPGVYLKNNSQLYTIRKHHSAFSNWHMTMGDYRHETLMILSHKKGSPKESLENLLHLFGFVGVLTDVKEGYEMIGDQIEAFRSSCWSS